jgi:molybdopterin synthase sulfur carrier subunit
VDVCFYATLRPIVGGKRVSFDLAPGTTVAVLLRKASDRFPELGPLIWEPGGAFRDFLKVFVDGREARYLQGLDTVIASTAEVDIFPPVAGG